LTAGAFLSGGLDSSTVAGVLSQLQATPARTFTIGFGYSEYDELPFARIANDRFGCEGHEYVIRGGDIAATFHKIAQAYDEPFGNSSALPTYHCAVMARNAGIDHLLAGDGGDELFAGNSRYADQQIFEWYQRVPSVLRHRLLEPALKHWPHHDPAWLIRKARGYVEKAKIPLPDRMEAWNFIFGIGPETILQPEFLGTVSQTAPFERMREVWHSTPSQSTLHRMLFYDWHYTLADNDLRKVEVMSALAGVRVSYPMLHHGVVGLSLMIPPEMLMPGRSLRDFYKRAMRGFLPDAIIDKKKHGFGLPFGLWLKESAQLRDVIFDSLANLRGRGIVRPQFLNRLLELHGSEDARYYGVFVWVLAMLEQWFEEHRIAP
jgi:asparagine synthase (glutamine-hydrolysing)